MLVRTNESKNTLKKYEKLTQTIIMKNIKKLNLIETFKGNPTTLQHDNNC